MDELLPGASFFEDITLSALGLHLHWLFRTFASEQLATKKPNKRNLVRNRNRKSSDLTAATNPIQETRFAGEFKEEEEEDDEKEDHKRIGMLI
ncbi:hypothetical protein POX_b02125 [Penicillium oxalicum]|uniref:Uncharacterized protein n=1 Tax=Penicillium oxalicum (strain 114-2 / CGMCC 5302) TaxID=933388 RepID=S7ZQH5_PENO1|nr:hypothetical protein POX_b02125 [Penicillium oxalicum]EPS30881.1 hypothetical protein PDE_05833 [Penicillium oxalicum 114-2]KAI2792090.1 hypothetical protein POX_b02125 [Penicillium oxalicum]